MSVRIIRGLLATGVLIVISPALAAACAVCGLDSLADPITRGFSGSILFLMGMPFAVVGVIGGGLFYMNRRALTRRNFEIQNSKFEWESVSHKETTQ